MLADKLMAKLNKPKQADYDIEDEDFNYKGNDNNQDDDDEDDDQKELEEFSKRDHYVSVSKSKIRDDSLNLGEKYTGSKVGRNELFDEQASEDDESNDEESDILADVTDSEEEDQSDDENNMVEEEDEEEEQKQEQEVSGSEQNESENDESDIDDDELYKRNKIVKLLDSEKKQILSRLSTSAKSDALKGYTILKQGSEYDRILDARIKLQKAMLSANSLPINQSVYNKNKTKESDLILESTEEKLYLLIDKLIRVRADQLLKDGLLKNKVDLKISKKRKLSDYLAANKTLDEAVTPVTKSVLMKWSNRVQSASGMGALNQGKFKVINQNVWTQVNNQLGDVERLIKKTKVNRRGVIPMGYSDETESRSDDEIESEGDDENDVKTAGLSNVDKSLQTNSYIFDDDDFYRLLLNDMINKKLDQKQANNSAVLMLSKNKMQKNYDRMATKGRKLKYTVQEPLVQFEIPRRKYYSWGDDQIDELFSGLFGMSFNMDDSDDSDNEETNHDEQHSEDITALKESGVKLFG